MSVHHFSQAHFEILDECQLVFDSLHDINPLHVASNDNPAPHSPKRDEEEGTLMPMMRRKRREDNCVKRGSLHARNEEKRRKEDERNVKSAGNRKRGDRSKRKTMR